MSPPPDRPLLAFAAEQRLITAEQGAVLLGATVTAAAGRLRGLAARGLLTGERPLRALPMLYRISRSGARAIGSDLAASRAVDVATCRHDVGVAWLALAAHRGRFGEMQRVVSERRMRSEDRRADREARWGVRLGGYGPSGRDRLHYPDLLLVTASGDRIAFELELTAKGRTRRETIIAAYAGDARIEAAVYLVPNARTARAIEESAARVGASDRVHVRLVQLAPGAAGRDPGSGRRATRALVAGPDRGSGR